MGKKKRTTKQFIEEMKVKNPNIEILGEYIGYDSKIDCECKICSHKWSTTPHSLLSKKGCPMCYNNRRGKTSRKPHEQFMKEFYEKNPNANNIKILNEYIKSDINMDCECKICDHQWSTTPSTLLRGSNCPKCAVIEQHNQQRKTHEQFIKEMKIKHPNIKILGEYIDNSTNIECECLIDGYKWSPTPNSLSNGHGCLQCSIRNNKGENSPRWNHNKTQEEREDDRSYSEYKEWIVSVYEKDNYTCQCCGQHGGKLNAHHKDGYNWCIERRIDIDNGVTLCEDCHKEFHRIYGKGNNTEQQFIEFINNNNNNNKEVI